MNLTEALLGIETSQENNNSVEKTNCELWNSRIEFVNCEEVNLRNCEEEIRQKKISGNFGVNLNSERNFQQKNIEDPTNLHKYCPKEDVKIFIRENIEKKNSRDVFRCKTRQNDGGQIEKFIGDGLTIRLDKNEHDIQVTGDGCRLNISKNFGKIRMIGDGCRLKIGKNMGEIEYRGDGGRVTLGPDSTRTNVQYFGEGGRVNVTNSHNSTSTPAAAMKKSDTKFFKTSENVEKIAKEISAGRFSRTTLKTVRIIYDESPKVISTKRGTHSSS